MPSISLDSVRIRQMQPSDLPGALALSTEIGWNQTAADWQRMLQLEPKGCFVAESDGHVVGTTLCCVFGSVAWLAMVIVTESLRGHGLGQNLVQHGLDYARQCGIATVRLDATVLGEAVYRKFGFQRQFELIRMAGVSTPPPSPASDPSCAVTVADPSDIVAILEFDRQATQTDRSKLLRHLCRETAPWVAVDDQRQPQGWLACRHGRLATHIGPCSGSLHAAVALLRHALKSSQGNSVIVDFPADHSVLLGVAQDFGLTPQRTLLRMCCGPAVIEDSEHFHASYGGEFG